MASRRGRVQIDAVQQRRTAPCGDNAGTMSGVQRAFAAGLAKASTRGTDSSPPPTGNAPGSAHTILCPGNHDVAGLQRLPEHLQRLSVELWQLIEEQHAEMRERDFAGLRLGAAHQRRTRGRVMGLSKWTLRPVGQRHATGSRLDRRHLQCFALESTVAAAPTGDSPAASCRCPRGH